MTKKIYFEPAGRIHSSQWDLINYPPEGYEFITDKPSKRGRIVNSDLFFFKSRRLLESLLPLNLTKARLEGFVKKYPQDIDLIYSYNHPVFKKKPWIVFVEWAHVLVGRNIRHFTKYKRSVERLLASDYCKGILTWTELARESILLNFNCADFEHKIEVVPQAITKRNFVKDYHEKGKVKLLFVGSINAPDTFEYKGGGDVLETFVGLSERYPNIELLVRAKVPERIKVRYQGVKGIRIYDAILPQESIEQLFKDADIFLYPTHQFHNTVILEAMSYELPVVTIDCGPAREYINDGQTGFVVEGSDRVPYFMGNKLLPTQYTSQRENLFEAIRTGDAKVVQRLVKATSILIENHGLRRRMGEKGRWEAEHGKFSIQNRNEKLKKIFDEATGER